MPKIPGRNSFLAAIPFPFRSLAQHTRSNMIASPALTMSKQMSVAPEGNGRTLEVDLMKTSHLQRIALLCDGI